MSLWKKLRRLESRIQEISFRAPPVPGDPLSFCEEILGFNPTGYQRRLLESDSKRIVVRWARQSGKTTALATLRVLGLSEAYLCWQGGGRVERVA